MHQIKKWIGKRLLPKERSVFWSTTLLLLTVLFLANALILLTIYHYESDNTLKRYQEEIRSEAALARSLTERFDLSRREDAEECSALLGTLCRRLDVRYMYILKIDRKARSETYLAIGTQTDWTETDVSARDIGDKVTGMVNREQLAALRGDTVNNIVHESNEYGDDLICYLPRDTAEYPDQIIGAEKAFTAINDQFQRRFRQSALLTTFLTAITVLGFALILYYRVSLPAGRISRKMKGFVNERESGFEKLQENGSTEFHDIARSFNQMAEDIDRYIKQLGDLNREKHTREAELNIARTIQLGLLPPDSFTAGNTGVRAFMQPAREVGGDLYDYRIRENGTICLAVADVSGKGVSAALFMSRAVTLLGQYALQAMTPAEAVTSFNRTLADNNPNGLFITAFVAVFDPLTGRLTYTNAGHNPPYVLSDRLIALEDAHGMAAGIFPEAAYEEASVTLRPGDAFFVYTDGINEAENRDGAFYGTEALEQLLRRHGGDREQLLSDLRESINAFADGAVQSDDMTALLLTYQGGYHRELTLDCDTRGLLQINEAIDGIPGIPDDLKDDLRLMAEEIYVNQCSYAYEGENGEILVKIEASDKVEMTFTDSGRAFDPTKEVPSIEDYDFEHSVGGLGRFIVFSMADDYCYRYENGRNILKIVKAIAPKV